ncbi:MAG: hypothetical protein P8M25_04965 [Paracoccaceae bacterium]|jgi:hypothetical protein|nr:hypothetical protein [Paracoccaceae bacterium]
MYKYIYGILLIPSLLSACMQQVGNYTSPEDSGLVSIRPYPEFNDVCQILGESTATEEFQDYSSILIGCPNHEIGAIKDRQSEGAKIVSIVNSWTLLQIQEPQNQSDADVTYGGYTVVYYEPQHGTQVEYHGKNRTSFLWYPENTGIVFGDWRVEGHSNRPSTICYRYQTNSYNPVTKVRGGNWECRNIMSVQADIQNRIVGDPFGLVTGKVPFVLERHKKITLAELVRRAGISDRNLIDHGTP